MERRNVETIDVKPCETSVMAAECLANTSCTAAGTFSSNRRFFQRKTKLYVSSTCNEDETGYPQDDVGTREQIQQRKSIFWHVTRLNYLLRNRAHRTFVFFTVCTDYRWSGQRAKLIALSCLFFVIPALTLLPVCAWEALLWAAVCVVSYLADYTFSGRRDTVAIRAVHMTDRYLASVMLGIQIIYNIPLWFHRGVTIGATGTVFTIASCFCKYLGGETDDFQVHVIFHSLWHVLGSTGRATVAFLEYPGLRETWGFA